MTCREIDNALIGGQPLSPEVREHLAHCASCRELADALDGGAPSMDPGVLDRARGAILQPLTPVKPMAPAAAFAILLLLTAAAVAAGVARLSGIHGLPVLTAAQAFAVFGALLALLALAAYSVAGDMRPGARTVSAVVVFGVAVVAMEAIFLTLFPDYSMGRFVHSGIVCFGMGSACAVVTALLAWLIVRRGYVVAPVSAGATIGALAGLAGLAALELHCPILTVPHLAVWHAGVLVASVGAGAAVGKWISR